MPFLDDISDEFETILAGEFSSRIVFSPGESGEWDATCIFDDTYEPIGQDESGAMVVARSIRAVVYYKSRPRNVVRGEIARVYSTDVAYADYKVDQIQPEGEGNALVTLIK